jgi:hypothetical protein
MQGARAWRQRWPALNRMKLIQHPGLYGSLAGGLNPTMSMQFHS